MGNLKRAVVVVVVFAFFAVWCEAANTPGADGKALFENNCGKCHSLNRPKSQKKTKEEWRTTVSRMRDNGATITGDEAELIINYLSENYGK